MLYPTELRARVIFQSLTKLVLDNRFAKCSGRVLLEILVNLLSSLGQVSLLNRIVTFPHLFRLMADDFHSCCRINSCPSEVGRGAMAEVMEPEVSDTCLSKRGLERATYSLKRPTFVREDMPGRETANPSESLKGYFDIRRHGNLARRLCLGVRRTKSDKSPLYIDAIPREAHNFAKALPKLVGG